MFVPYTTDAPVYHFPAATIGIISANVLIYFATIGTCQTPEEMEALRWLMLEFDMINPIQWITGSFMHAGFMHLAGNMIFLWTFGLIVEGKLGWQKFLAIYMGMTLIDGAVVQLPMFLITMLTSPEIPGAALGASGVIFALMAIAVVWAPENEVSCFMFIGFYFFTFEIRIIMMGAFYTLMQLVFFTIGGFSMSSELLHIIGLAIGFPVGLYLLKKRVIDCEGWDILSRYGMVDFYGKPTKKYLEESREVDPVEQALALERARVPSESNSSNSTQEWQNQTTPVPGAAVPPGSFPAQSDASFPSQQPEFPGPGESIPSFRGAPLDGAQSPFAGASVPATPDQDAAPLVPSMPSDQFPGPANASAPPALQQPLASMQQALSTGDADAAIGWYSAVYKAKGIDHVTDSMITQLVTLLGNHNRHVESLHPLGVLAKRDTPKKNQVILRIAQIQVQQQRKPHDAVRSLKAMTPPFDEATALKRQKIYEAAKRLAGEG